MVYHIHEVIWMDENFIRDRITQLRLRKGVSEYQTSYDLGHSRGYHFLSYLRSLGAVLYLVGLLCSLHLTLILYFSRGLNQSFYLHFTGLRRRFHNTVRKPL